MKKMLALKLLFIAVLSITFSCSNDDPVTPIVPIDPEEPVVPIVPIDPIDPDDPEDPDGPSVLTPTIALSYSQDNGATFPATYTGVRIGEYYWMNSNFTAPFEHDITKEQIDFILKIYNIDPAKYPISTSDFNKYYGQYYSRTFIEYMSSHGRMYEGNKKVKNTAWRMPTKSEFRQLFGMCGNGQLIDVRTFLSYKPNEVSVASPVIGWFSSLNSNRYGFNLLPGGARYHGETPETFKIRYPDGSEKSFSLTKGGLYNFTEVASFVCIDGTVSIHDYPDTSIGKMWHWLNMRWCRKITDEELGYKLYINTNKTDIKKLGLKAAVPAGYTELPTGYIRGFYVQYILDNPKPEKTVTQIVAMANGLR